MENEPGCSILAFDVFGTVVDWRSGVIAAGERVVARRGLSVDWPAFADAWRDAYQPTLDTLPPTSWTSPSNSAPRAAALAARPAIA